MEPGPARTTWRYASPAQHGRRELLAARLWAAGAVGVWERADDVVAWFVDRRVAVPDGGTWSREPDRDWQAEWKATVSPVAAGRITVVPSWLAHDHVAGSDELVVVLDPGRAFGSGHHATTTLCLEALQTPEIAAVVGGGRLLDVGTGTGVLGIAAHALGAAEVVAVDVAADALEVARDNVAHNGAALDVRHGSVAAADGETFDVVVANLVTDTLVELAAGLSAAVRPGGWLVASGIAAGRAHAVTVALVDGASWDGWTVDEHDGWVAIRGRRT